MGKDIVTQLADAARSRMQTQGEFSPALLEEIADELIDEFMRDGLITDDDDIETLKTDVIDRVKSDLEA
jgi:hypothetical protein